MLLFVGCGKPAHYGHVAIGMSKKDLLTTAAGLKVSKDLIGPTDPGVTLYERFPKTGARSERYYVKDDKVKTIVVLYGPGSDYNAIVAKLSEDNGGPTNKSTTTGVTTSTWVRNGSLIVFSRVGGGATKISIPFGKPIKLQPNASILVITGQ